MREEGSALLPAVCQSHGDMESFIETILHHSQFWQSGLADHCCQGEKILLDSIRFFILKEPCQIAV